METQTVMFLQVFEKVGKQTRVQTGSRKKSCSFTIFAGLSANDIKDQFQCEEKRNEEIEKTVFSSKIMEWLEIAF